MSRSYRKHPVTTDRASAKDERTRANRRVRHTKDFSTRKGNQYKKLYEQYDIRDWSNRWTWEEAIQDWESGRNVYLKKHFPTLKEYRNFWEKCTIRK